MNHVELLVLQANQLIVFILSWICSIRDKVYAKLR